MNTLPILLFRLGYLKFQGAFFYPTYRLLFFGACRVCAAGAHAVARYAKLPVIPAACVRSARTLHGCDGKGYLKIGLRRFQVAFLFKPAYVYFNTSAKALAT